MTIDTAAISAKTENTKLTYEDSKMAVRMFFAFFWTSLCLAFVLIACALRETAKALLALVLLAYSVARVICARVYLAHRRRQLAKILLRQHNK